MIYIYIFIMFMLAILSLYIYKDVLSPPFLFCLPWILCLMGLTVSDYSYSPHSFVYFYIILGAFVFIIGFALAMNNARLKKRYIESKEIYIFKPSIFRFLIFFEIIITLYLYFIYYSFIRSHYIISVYQTIRQGLTTGSLVIPIFLVYARSCILILSICIVTIYFNIQKGGKKKFQKIVSIQILLAVMNLMTVMTRNGILISALPMLISFLVGKNFDNKKMIKYSVRFLVAFLGFFSVIAVMKSSYLGQYNNYFDLLISQFSLYMSGSVVALEKYMESYNDYLYGQNTFRFFLAILNKLLKIGQVQQLVQNSIAIGNGQVTNVYTFYHYYMKDFGMTYALIIQFLIAIFHGVLYRMMLSKKPVKIYYFSIMIYPLIMQFFEDQYISLLSTWIQHLLLGWIFFKSKLFILRIAGEEQMPQQYDL